MQTGNLFAVADWHADKAMSHYQKGEFENYTRHIAIADRLRREAYAQKRKAA